MATDAVQACEVLPSQRTFNTSLGSIPGATLFLLQLISTLLYRVIKLVTISIPAFILTASWTITMNAPTLLIILASLIFILSCIVRYRVLTLYSRLPPEPQRKEPAIDLFPDLQGSPKSRLSSYLDEFLSAIKIFGYLERPVFHELTRSMQTRKLIAGETLNLQEEKGFCVVVEGLMEIFVKSGGESGAEPDQYASSSSQNDYGSDSLNHQKYQLLTEIRTGVPMSSLFSIMSLFTEDIELSQLEDDPPIASSKPTYQKPPKIRHSMSLSIDSPTVPLSLPTSPDLMGTSIHLQNPPATIPPISLDSPGRPGACEEFSFRQSASRASAHPDIIARATVDTTIAIIPATAFKRLIKIYPKATTHIVHVILSRFQRVTLAQAYTYLGLTREVLQVEKAMIQHTICPLPNELRGAPLNKLKEKFKREREKSEGEGDANKGIALHNTAVTHRDRSNVSLKEAATHATAGPPASSPAILKRNIKLRSNLSPGDLVGDFHSRPSLRTSLSSLDVPDGPASFDKETPLQQRSFNPFDFQAHQRFPLGSQDIETDNLFRVSVLECIFKALGFGEARSGFKDARSNEGSPRLISYDQKRQKAVFSNNAFGFMGPSNTFPDSETESLASTNTTVAAPPTAQTLTGDMKDEVEIIFFPKGSVLVEQWERSPGIYYVIDGFLELGFSQTESPYNDGSKTKPPPPLQVPAMSSPQSIYPSASGHRRPDRDSELADRKVPRERIALIKPGGLAGYISTVASFRSFVDVVARTDVYVGFLPRSSLEKIVDRYPIALLTLAKRLTSSLPRLILHIDFALEWVQVEAGQVIFQDGDESDSIYFVLNGRLRLVVDVEGGGIAVKAEYGQGASVGELEVLTESARTGTLHVVRDTELVKFPRTLFNSLAQEHPNVTLRIARIIASRTRSYLHNTSGAGRNEHTVASTVSKAPSSLNLRTVALLPVTAGVPVIQFADCLMEALDQVRPPGGATSLNQSGILKHLGRHAFSRIGKLRLSQYLADLEETYGLVIYVADTAVNSPWTQTCITQADCILLVGMAESSPEIGEYERFMLGMKSTARKTLVLIHADRYSSPGLARSWLRNRMWINGGHHHVQMPLAADLASRVHASMRRSGTSLRERVQSLQAEIVRYASRKARPSLYPTSASLKGDFHRLARRLCGKSIGLVLGGGGARGISQIGIIRAIEEEGIPIDMVGGTSIGAFIGALYARHADVVPLYGLSKKFAGRMASMWRLALDLTYPFAAYTTGHEFNRGIYKTFGNSQIEDFWLDYYCNTTNISQSRVEYHTSGYAWRYVRASMSLAGLLPPLCDEGSLLLDGGYIDNLTVSRMKSLGADVIFAVDVGAVDDKTPQTYGDSLSGLWAFCNRWNPFSAHPNPPVLGEIQARLAYVSSVDALERAKAMPGCVYMRPPIDAYATLDFGKFDDIYQVGYDYGRDFLRKLRASGALAQLRSEAEEEDTTKLIRRTTAPRRLSI